ncbi:hypothetical protein [Anatilimnocola floriformis]|uniref:hypothetical protein n=1 Tax=Anatilimnocola floriformis TaxID=2948575 RepID=UPI0020C42D96|nr:hypothetical protein [Anatilimnocola floriformis]
MKSSSQFGAALAIAWLVACSAGCAPGPQFGKIAGKLTIPGHTAEDIRIEFHPDAAAGTQGPSSVGETDAEGNFTLACALDSGVKEGAIVGKHRVVLQDLRLSKSETGRGIVQRFSPLHSAVLTTPLVIEVKPGEQSLTLQPQAR